jgi:hypothetical protein
MNLTDPLPDFASVRPNQIAFPMPNGAEALANEPFVTRKQMIS